MEWITSVYNLLNTPGGILVIGIGIVYTSFLGIWRWKREFTSLEKENASLWRIVERLAGVQETNTKVAGKAVSLAEFRIQALKEAASDEQPTE